MGTANFYAGESGLWMAGQIAIAFLFVFRGLDAVRRFDHYARQIAARGLPLPRLAAATGFAIMLVGGSALALDWFAAPAAAALIVFTMVADYVFHHFWAMEGMERAIHFYFFVNNIAVIGGLVLVIAR